METEAGGAEEEKAGGVDGFVAFHVVILVETMVGLAESDAWDAVGHQAKVDWVKASKELISPRASISWALLVQGITTLSENIVEAVLPVIQVVVVNWTSVVISTNLLLGWDLGRGHGLLFNGSRHCD